MRIRACFWVETVLGLVCGSLAVATLFWRDWVEAVTGFDPDQGNGSAEWIVVAGLAAVAIVVGAAAGREWRRARALAVAAD